MKKMKYDPVSAGSRIKRARKAARYTQAQLAEIIGMHESNLSGLERGARGMSLDYLMTLSKALHVTTDYILFGEDGGGEKSPSHKLMAELDSQQREYVEKILELSVDFVKENMPAEEDEY